MNLKETIKALYGIDKRVCPGGEAWPADCYLRREGHALINQDGCACSWEILTAHGEWVEWVKQEPNEHPKGTFSWAREEHRRGNTVRRRKGNDCYGEACEAYYLYLARHEGQSFDLSDFDATDWEVVE